MLNIRSFHFDPFSFFAFLRFLYIQLQLHSRYTENVFCIFLPAKVKKKNNEWKKSYSMLQVCTYLYEYFVWCECMPSCTIRKLFHLFLIGSIRHIKSILNWRRNNNSPEHETLPFSIYQIDRYRYIVTDIV